MAKKETIEMIIDGGKAAPNAAIAQKLGPMKIPIPKVMEEINKKTIEFKGMKIPVKIIIDPQTKEFTIEVGSPSVTELIKKEMNLEKGSGTPNRIKSANIAIEQVVKIARMKHDALLSRDMKASVKQIVGSCGSLGMLIESKESHDINEAIKEGKYDIDITNPKELTKEKTEKLKADLTRINDQLKKELEKAEAEKAAVAAEAAAKLAASGAATPAATPAAGAAAAPGATPAAGAAPAAGGKAPAAGATPAKAEEKKAPAKK
ncbi:MAG: 50S ribosomal protein L11 [Nanoarchaeota archaeon]|nr:50S ribosomal protein L11 [Nanoarchaeota archaeon]